MIESTQSATLSALKRADFDAEAVGDRIAMKPADLNALLARASAIQDAVELRKQETGAEMKLASRCAVIALSWRDVKAKSEDMEIKTLMAARAALRQTDVIIRRGPSEIVVIAHKITSDERALATIGRLHRVAPEPTLVGYVRVEHPTRLALALEGAYEALRGASEAHPIVKGSFECPGAVSA